MPPAPYPTFIELQTFRRRWEELGLSDKSLLALQRELGNDPDAGMAVPGGGGLRKVRFSPGGRGKRGAYRVYFISIADLGVIVLSVIFAKNETADISRRQRELLKMTVLAIEAGLREQIKEYHENEE